MPRDFARIVGPVIQVKAEWVQGISPSDCEAEGITEVSLASPVRGFPYEEYRNSDGLVYGSSVEAFSALWDSINGQKPGCSWKDNPPVWGYECEWVTP